MTCRPMFVALTTLALAGSAPAHPKPVDRPSSLLERREYVDVRSYFTEPEHIDRWYALTFSLKADFDAICGDTFCEGDYANYESLGFRCSVEQNTGTVGAGEVRVQTEAWRCSMPIVAGTSAGRLLEALSAPGQQPLYAPLPGSERALYDGLVDCL